MAQKDQDCAARPPFTSLTCSIAQEQCCRSEAGQRACDDGIKMARGQRACERPLFSESSSNTRTSQVCCDCCLLGLMAANMSLSCEVHGLPLGKQCSDTAKTCCQQPEEVQPTAAGKRPERFLGTEKPEVVTAHPPLGDNTCRDSNCTQLCVGNDTCACHEGFQLKTDGVTCEDVNECLNGSHNCTPGHVCLNTEGSFRCQSSCGTGFILVDINVCRDIDECALGTHNCGVDFVCINTAGSFSCHPRKACGGGYIQDTAGSCIDVNECVAHPSPCQPGQTCINTIGSYKCRSNKITCARGYHLTVNGTHCEDVNECLLGKVCVGHGCVNSEGSYRCECQPGYTFNFVTKLCEDVNECRQYPGRLCAHKCENTKGSYFCSCATGFKLAPDGRNCEDVNECELSPCSQECANVYGSYQCYCHRGYQLSDIDGITCEDIDECALPNVCSYRCLNTPGGFNCTCPPSGFTLARDGRTCQDIDECAAGTHTCSATESCVNVQGGFRCLFFECPPNFRRALRGSSADASVIVRCVKACQQQDTDCLHNPVHIITSTVLSLPTLQSFSEPQEIVFLRTAAAAKPVPLPDEPDVYFEIVATDEQSSFDVVKRSHHGMIVGVIRQLKPIIGPRELVLEVTMDYVQSGLISQKNIVIIQVFISEFWF
ncbi:fibulin-1-like [Leuresthes tenuis]|uniref:fibulin-1-like n=1 Tax=Leuresthes tenuis TaxID=355514 RepID=UPI003B5049EA